VTIGGKVSARGYHRREGEGGCVTDDARTYATTRAANRRKQRQTTGAAEGEGDDDASAEPAEGEEDDRGRSDAVDEKKKDEAKEEERGVKDEPATGEPANDDRVVAPANPVEAKSAPAKKTQPRERKAPGAKKGTKRSGMKQDEHEIAEALFDLATLAADVDKEPEGKASKRKKPRTTKKASAPARGAKAIVQTVLGADDAARGGLPPVYAGMGLPQLGAFPPPVPPLGVANPFHPQVPRTKPFRNATSHVYIAHFIDFTQKVSKQTVTTHQDAMAAAAEKGGDEAQRRAQTGDASTSGPPFGGMPPGGFSPFMMNPYLMGAFMAGQPMGPGGGGPDASQQAQLLNMMMQQAAAVPLFANQPMGFPLPMGTMNSSQQAQGGGGERGGAAGVDSSAGVNPYLSPMFAMQNPMMLAAMGSAMPSQMQQYDHSGGNEKVGAPAGDAPPAGAEAPKVEAK